MATITTVASQAAPVPDTSIVYGVNDPNGTPSDINFTISVLRETILGSPQTAISDPSGGSTVDSEARTAINSIIDALEAAKILNPA